MQIRQRATAMYLIDQFALRAGNEKDSEEEADTVGCCSLRFEHVTLELPNMVIFDFLGKDSIRFYNKFPVDPQVFKNLKIFKKSPKTTGDMIFDRLNVCDTKPRTLFLCSLLLFSWYIYIHIRSLELTIYCCLSSPRSSTSISRAICPD